MAGRVGSLRKTDGGPDGGWHPRDCGGGAIPVAESSGVALRAESISRKQVFQREGRD